MHAIRSRASPARGRLPRARWAVGGALRPQLGASGCALVLAATPCRIAEGRHLRAHHLCLIIPDGDYASDAVGVAAGAPRRVFHSAQLATLIGHAVELLYVVQGQRHGIPLHECILVPLGNPRNVILGSQLDLLRVQHLDWGAEHALPMDVLGQGWQPLLDGHIHPARQRVGHDAHDPVLLRYFDRFDCLALQVLHHVAEELVVGEGVPEPLGNHVTPVHHGLNRLRVPFKPVVDEALEHVADPGRRAEGVVPIEEEYCALVGEGPGKTSRWWRGADHDGALQDHLRERVAAEIRHGRCGRPLARPSDLYFLCRRSKAANHLEALLLSPLEQ
mmetsp:Transcript_103380/g.275018  ORF Transcript_103380/g.275018 Transcript_103380/m.275018 type:complete len:332 (-) Transcript_103380:277-1272(-)